MVRILETERILLVLELSNSDEAQDSSLQQQMRVRGQEQELTCLLW